MAESDEHKFLKEEFLKILRDFSKLNLYGFKESERKKFDFSCLLQSDWKRPLIGQTLWKNPGGMDKDIRTLLSDKNSEIKVCIAKNNMRYKSLLSEIINDYKKSKIYNDLFKLKIFWVPSDFKINKSNHRNLIAQQLKSDVIEDILFNVVFGNISADNISFFLNTSGQAGLNLSILHEIAVNRFVNITGMSNRINVSAGPIREKLITLTGAGFLVSSIGELRYEISLKGMVFLKMVSRLLQEIEKDDLTPELKYILDKLNCRVVKNKEIKDNKEVFPSNHYIHLVKTINAASEGWGIDFKKTKFKYIHK